MGIEANQGGEKREHKVRHQNGFKTRLTVPPDSLFVLRSSFQHVSRTQQTADRKSESVRSQQCGGRSACDERGGEVALSCQRLSYARLEPLDRVADLASLPSVICLPFCHPFSSPILLPHPLQLTLSYSCTVAMSLPSISLAPSLPARTRIQSSLSRLPLTCTPALIRSLSCCRTLLHTIIH